MFAAGL
jgi:hypothetical protein